MEICFWVGMKCDYLKNLMFSEDDMINYLENSSIEDIAVRVGIFQSKTQARKNGFQGEIQEGFHEYTWGKNKHKIYIYKMTERARSVSKRFYSRYKMEYK